MKLIQMSLSSLAEFHEHVSGRKVLLEGLNRNSGRAQILATSASKPARRAGFRWPCPSFNGRSGLTLKAIPSLSSECVHSLYSSSLPTQGRRRKLMNCSQSSPAVGILLDGDQFRSIAPRNGVLLSGPMSHYRRR